MVTVLEFGNVVGMRAGAMTCLTCPIYIHQTLMIGVVLYTTLISSYSPVRHSKIAKSTDVTAILDEGLKLGLLFSMWHFESSHHLDSSHNQRHRIELPLLHVSNNVARHNRLQGFLGLF